MPIIRREKASRFFTLSRETAQDRTLSYEARGMLGYLLSHSDGWEAQLQDRSPRY